MAKDATQELIQSNKALIAEIVKMTCTLDEQYKKILFEIGEQMFNWWISKKPAGKADENQERFFFE